MTQITLATSRDAADMAEIHMRSWEAAYARIIPAEYIAEKNAARPEMWKKTLSGENDRHYIIKHEDRAAGIMGVAAAGDDDLDADVCELNYLYLHPGFFRRGIGTQAMEFALGAAKSREMTAMALYVLEENTAARRFYEKRGFMPDGIKKEVTYGRTLTALRYRREI